MRVDCGSRKEGEEKEKKLVDAHKPSRSAVLSSHTKLTRRHQPHSHMDGNFYLNCFSTPLSVSLCVSCVLDAYM